MNTIPCHPHPRSLRLCVAPFALLAAIACSHEPARDPTSTDVATGEPAKQVYPPTPPPPTPPEPTRPEPSANCECFFSPNAPPPTACDAAGWFCNGAGDCSCQRAWLGDATERDPDAECACTAGTPSPPRGDCAEDDWFCNPSGACRCRS